MNIRIVRLRPRAIAVGCALLAVVVAVMLPQPAFAEDRGFWYGADSGGPGPVGSGPYDEPSCGAGHAYGGYIGKIGGADLVGGSNTTGYGPGNTSAWNAIDAAAANTNHFTYGKGVGAGGYWFAFGPNKTLGTGDGPYNWGKQQAQWALGDWARWFANGTHRMPLRILWFDVEGPGSNGWSTTDHAANRQVFNGFFDAVAASSQNLEPGVYSTQVQWDSIMSGNTAIPNTWEWTAQTSRSNDPTPCPNNFTSSNTSAVFFGGQTASSAKAAVWQWSQGNADYDQIDSNKALPD